MKKAVSKTTTHATRAAIRLYLDEYTDTHYRLIILQQRRIITKLERRIQCLQRKLPS